MTKDKELIERLALKPVIVKPTADPDEMNELHGESYGIDWTYPQKASDQLEDLARKVAGTDELTGDAIPDFATRFIAAYLTERGKEADCELIRTAPNEIYLQVSDHPDDREMSFPRYAREVTWSNESTLPCEVSYIRADLAQQPAIPEGMALVPIEPTVDMYDAVTERDADGNWVSDATCERIYKAMIAAAGVQL